ncbi:MAG TPA: secretin N-terminal domain-containing protein, partial [Thermoanaerobaculia bacterium]|nr:secretin N-terminal domain-containing protein [Thermoanaerobaculia bacterium]
LMLLTATAFADAADVGKRLTVQTFQFKHKQAEKAAVVIKPLLSVDGSMSIQPSANSLVVTDSPENIKRIAAALAQFDTQPLSLMLSVRLVGAARGGETRVDPQLKDIQSKLALLRYNVLESLGSADAGGREGEPGQIELEGYRADFKFGEYDPATDSVRVTDFRLLRLEGDTLVPLMKTTLNLKVGQTVILSAAKEPQSQRALMIVVTAKR